MELFKLFGSVFVNTDAADESLHKTEEKVGNLGKSLLKGAKTAGKFAAGVATAAAGAAAGLVKVASETASNMDVIDKASQKMGISTEAYQEWSHAMSLSGMDISVMQTGMKTLQNQMDGVTQGTKASVEAFERLGVSVYDENGAMKDQTTMMNEVIYALAEMEDGAERTALAVDFFGKSGTEMLPLLNSGAEGIEAMKQEAHDLGLVMSEDAVKSGAALNDAMNNVKDSVKALGNNLGASLMPVVQQVCDMIIEFMPTIREIIDRIGPVLGDVLQAILPVLFEMCEQLLPPLLQLVEALLPLFTLLCDTILPILADFLTLICNILVDYVIPAIIAVVNWVKTAVTNVIDFFKNFKTNMSNIWNGIVEVFKKPINAIIGFINKLVSGVVTGVNTVIKALNSLQIDVPDWVPGLGGKTFGFNLNELTAPQIPMLAKGGTLSSAGSVIVGEKGPELLNLPAGASVNPLGTDSDIVKISELVQKIYNDMPGLIASGIDQMKVEWSDRELARMVREYA